MAVALLTQAVQAQDAHHIVNLHPALFLLDPQASIQSTNQYNGRPSAWHSCLRQKLPQSPLCADGATGAGSIEFGVATRLYRCGRYSVYVHSTRHYDS